ncbi:MAG: winged helix-turn-helix domain-containing protein [Planctomycetota bacterium]
MNQEGSNQAHLEEVLDQEFHVLEDPSQIAVLRSQVRQAMIGIICKSGPISVPEIAEHLRKPDKSLYHHMRVLLKSNLVYEYDEQSDGRYTTKRYAARYNKFVFPREPEDDKTLNLILEIVGAGFRSSVRALRNEIKEGTVTREGPQRNLASGCFHGWVTPEELARVNDALNAIISTISVDAEPSPGATHVTYNFAFHRTPGMLEEGCPSEEPIGSNPEAQDQPKDADLNQGSS